MVDEATAGVQEDAPAHALTTLLHDVVMKVVGSVPAAQVATPTAGVLVVLQVIVIQLFPEVPVTGVHDATAVGPVGTVAQVVVVQLFPKAAVMGVHEATGVGPVLFGVQVVAM